MIKEISISTSKQQELVNVTDQIEKAVEESGVKEGICSIYVPHTTAAITINEGADPNVVEDIIDKLEELVPRGRGYKHTEGNADGHIKSTLVGVSLALPIKNAKLALGTWQSIFFCEFDGPRQRRIIVEIK